MTVNILSYASGNKRVMATVALQGGKPVINGTLPPRLREGILAVFKRLPPEDALAHLPVEFSGTYVRAELVR